MAWRKYIGSCFLGKKPQRTLNACWRLHRLWQRLMYCERRTVVCTDTASCCTDTASYGTDTVSYRQLLYSSGKMGLPALCSTLPPASNVGELCCMQPGLFSVYCLIHCTTTKTALCELPQALCWSAFVFSITRAVISLFAKHTLVLFFSCLWYFVSWGNRSDQTCFLFWMLSSLSCWQLLLPTLTSTYD